MALADIYQKATLVQIPSGYKAADAELYSVVPNTTAGDFTVSVDADATRVNKDGLIESVAANQARLNYDPTNPQDPHLLLEPTRINRVFPNNSLTGYSTIGVSTTNNDAIAPNGTNEGAKVQATTSGTAVVFKGFTGTSGVTHNISAFIKAGTHNQVRLQEGFSASNMDVNLSNGNIIANSNSSNLKVEKYPNDWYRVSFNFTSSGTNLQFALYFNGTYSSGENIYLYGGQIEEGSYATSLIPTSGSAVTRTADTCQKTSVASGLINQTEGVIFLDFENYGQIGTSYSGYFKIQSDGNDDRVTIQGDGSTLNRLILVVNDGSSTFFQPRTIIPLGRNKVAIRYKSGLVASFINGAKIDTSSTSFSFSNTLNTIQLQQPNKVHQAMIFNEALSDAEIITLTS